MVCPEGRLLHFFTVDADLVVAQSQIKLGEEFVAMKLVQQLVNDRNWEFIFDSPRVQGLVVDTESPGVVHLLFFLKNAGDLHIIMLSCPPY